MRGECRKCKDVFETSDDREDAFSAFVKWSRKHDACTEPVTVCDESEAS